ncbi:hypothetical protein VQ01_07205 [Tamlana sp. s12]|nr:hypothetical protein VQ01_07205 [Tamlana sp. s12]
MKGDSSLRTGMTYPIGVSQFPFLKSACVNYNNEFSALGIAEESFWRGEHRAKTCKGKPDQLT